MPLRLEAVLLLARALLAPEQSQQQLVSGELHFHRTCFVRVSGRRESLYKA